MSAVPPPPPPPPTHPHRDASEQPSSRATWALVLAIIPLGITWVVAAILAVQVLLEGRRDGRVKAFVALGVVGLWSVVVAVAGLVAIVAVAEDEQSTSAGGTLVDIAEIAPDDCLAETPPDSADALEVVPCDEPHREQAYGTFDLPAGTYPGEDQVIDAAESGCLELFEPWVGESYDDSVLDFSFFYPVEQNWPEDREVLCIAISFDEVTESLKGSRSR
ncbi:septum formation family protein [Aeromicrobium marinum]|uniref:septum formation family protein n=1 Tax=Aeromicrobium marinum TaxID=219314 RepID=UPI0001BCD4F0|nr:septum formation family protein [Aeromicrobium marinum]